MFLAIVSQTAFAQAPPQVGTIEYQKSDALIQTFILAVNTRGLRYTLVGASEDGIKSLRVGSGEFIADHKECYGAKSCQLSGIASLADMPSDVITVSVVSSKDAEQKEKLKISAENAGDKVYMITALPAFTGDQPLIITGTGDPTETDPNSQITTAPPAESVEFVGDKGPVITLSINKVSNNEFTFTILSTDASGIDFVEILENGAFLDVELCGGSAQCTMKKSITQSEAGEYTYIIKAMNQRGKISFQEELLTVE